jgi:putative membrane protein insertion efficiency factor
VTRPTEVEFLQTPLSDALSVGLFGAAGAGLELALWPVPMDLLAAAGVVSTALGPLGCAIERGVHRPLGRLSWLGLAALGASAYAGSLLALGLSVGAAGWVARIGSALALGWALTHLGPRLDRGELGWREAARRGPPDARSPWALRIAAWRPAPLAILEYLLLPLSWIARLPCLAAIRLYQLTLSRLMPPACQFEPTCSRYGFSAFLRHGVLRGGLLTGLRIVRCSPLSRGGWDPIPPRPQARACRTSRLRCPPSPNAADRPDEPDGLPCDALSSNGDPAD